MKVSEETGKIRNMPCFGKAPDQSAALEKISAQHSKDFQENSRLISNLIERQNGFEDKVLHMLSDLSKRLGQLEGKFDNHERSVNDSVKSIVLQTESLLREQQVSKQSGARTNSEAKQLSPESQSSMKDEYSQPLGVDRATALKQESGSVAPDSYGQQQPSVPSGLGPGQERTTSSTLVSQSSGTTNRGVEASTVGLVTDSASRQQPSLLSAVSVPRASEPYTAPFQGPHTVAATSITPSPVSPAPPSKPAAASSEAAGTGLDALGQSMRCSPSPEPEPMPKRAGSGPAKQPKPGSADSSASILAQCPNFEPRGFPEAQSGRPPALEERVPSSQGRDGPHLGLAAGHPRPQAAPSHSDRAVDAPVVGPAGIAAREQAELRASDLREVAGPGPAGAQRDGGVGFAVLSPAPTPAPPPTPSDYREEMRPGGPGRAAPPATSTRDPRAEQGGSAADGSARIWAGPAGHGSRWELSSVPVLS